MELVKKEIEVGKETSELSDCICDLVVSIKQSLNDGFQAGSDIPEVVLSNFQKITTAIEGLDKIDDEAKECAYKFALAWAASGEKVFNAFAKKA